MTDILKGNYELPEPNSGESKKRPLKSESTPDLTDDFEQKALAKLGGSMCFVMKGKTFLWTGEDIENPSP